MSSEPTTKRRKLEDGGEAATGVVTSAPVIDEHDLAKAKMILNALPQERLSELLSKCAETMPGIMALIEEAASGDASLKKLFVYNLSPTTTTETLQAFYSTHGAVKECKVIDGKNYGFVNFESVTASYNALHAVGAQSLDGANIAAKLADPPKAKVAAPSASYGGHGVGGGYSAPRTGGYGGGAPAPAPRAGGGGYGNGAPPAAAGGFTGGNTSTGAARAPDSEELKARKLFVRGIAWEGTKESIVAAYGQFGRVENVFVAMDRATGKTKGYAFVTMSTSQEAQNALANPMIELEGRRVTASLASEGANRSSGGATQSYYNNSGYGGSGGGGGGGYGGAAAGGYGGGGGGYGAAAGGGYGGGAPAAGGYYGGAPAAGGYGAAPAAGGYGAATGYGGGAPAGGAAGGYGASTGYGASRGY